MLSVEKFLEIEKKYNLYEDIIEGMNYWVYTRDNIWDDIILRDYLNMGVAHNVEKSTLKKKIQIYVELILNSIKAKSIKQAEICIVNHPRRVYKDGYYECVYTDVLAKKLSSNIVLEFPYQMQHLKPVKTDNLVYMDEVILRKILGSIFYKKIYKRSYKKIEITVRNRITKVLDDVENIFEIQINREAIIKFIVQEIIYYKVSINYIRKIINKISPKVVIEVVSYDQNCMMINEVCKEKDIKIIELQHGTVDGHIAYLYAGENGIKQFPDMFFSFSAFWKEYMKIPIKEENIVETGFPFFENETNNVKEIKEYCDDKINILFVSQGPTGDKLSKLAGELSERLDFNKYRIFYKLHPGEFANWRSNYPILLNGKIIVIDGGKYSLYEYFATSQIQIGVSSTAIYEGLGYGLSTYIYQIEMSEHMEMLCQKGYAKYFENCEVLVNYIREDSGAEQIAELWQRNALENMLNSIESIL